MFYLNSNMRHVHVSLIIIDIGLPGLCDNTSQGKENQNPGLTGQDGRQLP
jgi:hypothetical protein